MIPPTFALNDKASSPTTLLVISPLPAVALKPHCVSHRSAMHAARQSPSQSPEGPGGVQKTLESGGTGPAQYVASASRQGR
jgi:hypothetical protein